MKRRVTEPAISYNAWSVSVFLMLFWGFHYTVLEILHITPLGILLIELFAVATVMLMTVKRASASITPMLFWIVFWCMTMRNNYYLQVSYSRARPLATIMVIVLAYCLQFSKEWYRSLRQCITIFTVEHFLFAWFFFFADRFYSKTVIPMFAPDVVVRLISYQRENILIGFTSHYTISGIFFAFGCITALIFWLQNKKSPGRVAFLLLMMISLLMTQKRGPLLFTACAFVAVFFSYEGVRIRSVGLFAAAVSAAAGVYGIAVLLYPSLGNVFLRFVHTDFTSGRDQLYEIAWELFQKNPIIGAGWGQYRDFSLNYYQIPYDAHNIYLQALAELGVIGFAVMVVLLFGSFLYTLITCRKYREAMHHDSSLCFALLFSAGTQVYFICYGMTGNPIYDLQCFIPYFLSLAVPFSVRLNHTAKSRPGV